MEEEKNAGVPSGMDDSDSKKKKSGGKISKRSSRNKPKPGQGPANNSVEAETAAAAGHVETSSPPSQKRKSGPDDSEVEEEETGAVPVENTTGRNVVEDLASGKPHAEPSKRDPGRKGKNIKNENDGARMEPLVSRQLRPRKQPEIMRHVTVSDADAPRIVGRKIEVFWPHDEEWYPGLIGYFDKATRRHQVLYDDGDTELLYLNKERFKLQVSLGETFGKPVQSVEEEDDMDAFLARNGKDIIKGKANIAKNLKPDENIANIAKHLKPDENIANIARNFKPDANIVNIARNLKPDANNAKNLKRAAPRTKRLVSIQQIHQKHVSKGQAENAEKKQESIQLPDARQDAKQDEESRMKPSVAVSLTGDSLDDKGGGKQSKQKQIDDFTGKKMEASSVGGSEQMADLMDVKQINVKHSGAVDTEGLKSSEQGDDIQVERLSDEVESLDDKEAGGIVTDSLDEKETFGRQVPNQCDDDELETRSKTTDQQDEKDSNAKEHDENGPEEQEVVKDSDPSKKLSNKKHRGRAKAREAGKR